MAITKDDVLDPKGEITGDLFPADSTEQLGSRIDGWIAEAYAKAGVSDAAALQWVYYRAYAAVANRLMISPLKVSLTDQGSRERSQTQANHFVLLRDRAFAAFQELTLTGNETFNTGKQSGSVLNSFVW